LRSTLVIAEVAVSFILLIGAGLLINSFMHLRISILVSRRHMLTSMSICRKRNIRITRADRVLRRSRAAHPGAARSALGRSRWQFTVHLQRRLDADRRGRNSRSAAGPAADVIFRAIGPGYFSTMGIPLVVDAISTTRIRWTRLWRWW